MDHDVPARVSSAEEEEADLAPATVQRHALGERRRWRGRHETLLPFDVAGLGSHGFMEALIGPPDGFTVGEHLPRELVPDDLDLRRIDLVAVRVVEVEVGVDHVAHRLVGDRGQLRQER